MKTHNLTQGSAEWLAYRATHFNASDAPAMLGVSPYKTRTELLHELHTGLSPEVDPATQRRFDAGHAAEAAARPLAEREIGEELYPVVGSEGKLSASFDGLTMDCRIVWEHKLMNVDLADSLANGIIPDSYHPQLEQQLMVSGAEKALFMATSLDRTAMEHVWYTSRPELRSAILQGWTQFAIDLENYAPAPVVAEAVGRTPETLPALLIELTGMVTNSNLDKYKEHAMAVFKSINRVLKTDQDFADAEKSIKWCGGVEDRVAAAKQHALSQTETIDKLFKALDDIAEEARSTRLALEKLVKAEKENLRTSIMQEGIAAIGQHITALNTRLGKSYMPAVPADFAGAIKGKRTIDSLRDAVNTTLANAKIAASAIADKIDANLRHLSDVNAPMFLFSDVATICLKPADDFQMLVKSRISDHATKEAARIEAERELIRAEEQVKAEAAAKASADAISKAQTEVQKQAPAPVAIAPEAIETVAPVKPDMVRFGSIMVPRAQIDKTWPAKPAPVTPPELKLGQMADRLGFTLTAAFLGELGFEPAATDRASKLYHEADFPRICAALVKHISAVSELQPA